MSVSLLASFSVWRALSVLEAEHLSGFSGEDELVGAGLRLHCQASVYCEVPLQLLIESVLFALVNQFLLEHDLSLQLKTLLQVVVNLLNVPPGPDEEGEDVPPDDGDVGCLASGVCHHVSAQFRVSPVTAGRCWPADVK